MLAKQQQIRPNATGNWRSFPVVQYVVNHLGILIGFIVLCLFFAVSTDTFLTGSNILTVLRQISINAIIAFGMTLVILIRGIDLSVGSIVAVTGTLTVGLLVQGFGLPAALLAGVLSGAVFGFLNGFITAKGKIPSFIVTLAMMTIARGIAYIYTDGRPLRYDDSPVFNAIGNGYVGPIPVPIVIMLICLAAISILLNRTKFGRHVYAVGGNPEAAKFSGIPIKKIEIVVFTISGVLSALSGIILAARLNSGQPIAGQGFELDAIAAVVLGGTSFAGGIGRVGGTMIGALIIGVLSNGLNLLHVSFYYQLLIKGIVIIAAVYFDMMKKKA